MREGQVKWFDDNKGYGFIELDDSEDDAFVHHSDIQMDGYATLNEGQPVSFELSYTEKGPKALQVTPMEDTGSSESETPSAFEPDY